MKAKVSSFSALIALLSFVVVNPVQTSAQTATTPLPISIDEVVFEKGKLIAKGNLLGTPFTAPLNVGTQQNGGDGSGECEDVCPTAGSCPLLRLELGAIHLDVLGLKVDTSDICLLVTALPGDGNLLGNLLCQVAGLLDEGISLRALLNRFPELLDVLRDILNESLSAQSASLTTLVNGNGGACPILHLELGPVCLDVLGLVVFLHDCNCGPVVVDITAQPGEGNLLGNLLCGLLGILDPVDVLSIARGGL